MNTRLLVSEVDGRWLSICLAEVVDEETTRFELQYQLEWSSGGFTFVSDNEWITSCRIALSEAYSTAHLPGTLISKEGNLSLSIRRLGNGIYSLDVLAIPNMAIDDRIEFSLDRFRLA